MSYVTNAELKEELFKIAYDAQSCVLAGTLSREGAFGILEPCINRIVKADAETNRQVEEYRKEQEVKKSRVETVAAPPDVDATPI